MEQNPQLTTAFMANDELSRLTQVKALWPPLLKQGMHLSFVYSSFPVSNEVSREMSLLKALSHKDRALLALMRGGVATLRKLAQGNLVQGKSWLGKLVPEKLRQRQPQQSQSQQSQSQLGILLPEQLQIGRAHV